MIKHVVFDLGGVLIDWDPRYLYRKVFDSVEEMEYFLTEVCHMDWNETQDAGRDFEDGIEILVQQFPKYEEQIKLYYERWPEMLGGPIREVVEILGKLVNRGQCNLFAITNWSHQTYPIAKKLYSFLSLFQDVVISGVEKVRKPDPKIYQILLDRQQLQAEHCLFIDDNKRNVLAAQKMGMHSVVYTEPKLLEEDLRKFGIEI